MVFLSQMFYLGCELHPLESDALDHVLMKGDNYYIPPHITSQMISSLVSEGETRETR